MRGAPGMAFPQSGGWGAVMSSGPSYSPHNLGGPIGVSFLTPGQAAAKATRRVYGGQDDVDAGGYHLNQIEWDKDTGSAEVAACEPHRTGWYAPGPGVVCSCPPGGTCGCQ